MLSDYVGKSLSRCPYCDAYYVSYPDDSHICPTCSKLRDDGVDITRRSDVVETVCELDYLPSGFSVVVREEPWTNRRKKAYKRCLSLSEQSGDDVWLVEDADGSTVVSVSKRSWYWEKSLKFRRRVTILVRDEESRQVFIGGDFYNQERPLNEVVASFESEIKRCLGLG